MDRCVADEIENDTTYQHLHHASSGPYRVHAGIVLLAGGVFIGTVHTTYSSTYTAINVTITIDIIIIIISIITHITIITITITITPAIVISIANSI